MPICTAVLTAALLAGPAASPADPVPAAHKSIANKTTKQLQTPDKNSGENVARHPGQKVAAPPTQVDDDPVQESSESADSGDSDSGSDEASFQKSESWSSDPHAGGDSQVRETRKTRKSGHDHHRKNGKRSVRPGAVEGPEQKSAVDAPAAPAAGPAQAPVIRPAIAPAAKPAVKQAPAVKHALVVKQVPAIKQAPAVKHASVVKQVPAIKHASVVKQAPAIKHASVVKQVPAIKQAPAVKHPPVVKQAPAVKHAPEPRPALAPAVETPKAAEAALVKKEAAGAPALLKDAQNLPALKDKKEVEPKAWLGPDSKQAQGAPAADAATLDMPTAGSNPRDVLINPAGAPLPVNPYVLPAMPGLQSAVARSFGHHGHEGGHVGLRHPDHQRGHGNA